MVICGLLIVTQLPSNYREIRLEEDGNGGDVEIPLSYYNYKKDICPQSISRMIGHTRLLPFLNTTRKITLKTLYVKN